MDGTNAPRGIAADLAARDFSSLRYADLHVEGGDRVITSNADATPDCICTAGTVCRHNNACPRVKRDAAER